MRSELSARFHTKLDKFFIEGKCGFLFARIKAFLSLFSVKDKISIKAREDIESSNGSSCAQKQARKVWQNI